MPATLPLNFQDQAALMADSTFRGRVKVACLNFASYILDESPDTVGHSARVRWATSAYQMPDQIASQIAPPTTRDPNVIAQGPDIPDAELQTAVETVVNKMF